MACTTCGALSTDLYSVLGFMSLSGDRRIQEKVMSELTRRQFLKVTGLSVVGSSLAVLGFSPEPALAEVREYKLTRATETRNTCPYCSVA